MDSVVDKRLILVVGKGGVGRSTVAAAIANACARRGKRTLLYQYSASDRFGPMFGREPVGTKVVPLAKNLFCINTTPAAAIEEYGLMILRFRRVYRLVFENRISKSFIRAVPGVEDYAVLGKAWYHTEEVTRGKPVWDTIVFDMAASGHSLSMLRIPWVIVDTVPEGPLTRDARSVKSLLTDASRTAAVMVTLAEEMPVNEAMSLRTQLADELEIGLAHLVVNMVYPDRFRVGSPSLDVLNALRTSATTDPDIDAAVEHAVLEHDRRRLNERYLAELAQAIDAPHTVLPRLFCNGFGRPETEHLTDLIEARLT